MSSLTDLEGASVHLRYSLL